MSEALMWTFATVFDLYSVPHLRTLSTYFKHAESPFFYAFKSELTASAIISPSD